MKKLFFCVLAGLALASCGSSKVTKSKYTPDPPSYKFSFVSYDPLVSQGFYVSPSVPLSFEYDCLGPFELMCSNGYVKIKSNKQKETTQVEKPQVIKLVSTEDTEGMYFTGTKQPAAPQEKTPSWRDEYDYYTPTTDDALKELGAFLTNINADGVINISITSRPYGPYLESKLVVNGTAIKRKK